MINLLTRVLSAVPVKVFGETWTARDSNRRWAKIAMSGGGQYQIAYTDSIGTGANQLYVSSDYGSTWTAKESPRVWSDIKLSFDGEIQVALENNPTSGQIYISYDFGNTWEAKGPTIEQFFTYDFKFAGMSSDGQIITALTDGFMHRSVDSGNTWTRFLNGPWEVGAGAFSGVAMSLSGQRQIVGTNTYVFTSDNYGSSWTTALSRRDISQPVVSATAQIQMLFCKETQFQPLPQINVSVDFGATWAKKEFITTRDWRKLAISADGTRAAGIVGGNQIFVSSNTGNTWVSKLTATVTGTLFLLEMSSSGKNIIAASNQQIYVSTDFGENWALKYSGQIITDAKIASDGTRGSATLTTEKIYTTQRTRLI
jgi:hypothetical protein